MANVSADINTEVASDGARVGVKRLGGAEHLSAGQDDVVALPDHAANWTRCCILDKPWEERLGLEVSVVLLKLLLAGLAEFHAHEFKALCLESLEDGSDESSLDTIGLDHDICALSLGLDVSEPSLLNEACFCVLNPLGQTKDLFLKEVLSDSFLQKLLPLHNSGVPMHASIVSLNGHRAAVSLDFLEAILAQDSIVHLVVTKAVKTQSGVDIFQILLVCSCAFEDIREN